MKTYGYVENASNSETMSTAKRNCLKVEYNTTFPHFKKKREFLGTFIHGVQTTKMKGDDKSPNSDYILPLEGDKEMG